MQVAHPLKLLMTQIISKWNYYAILIEVELISSSVVLGLDAQKHDSVIYTYISVSSDSFPHRCSSNIEPFILNVCAVRKVLVFYFISVCSYLLISGFPGGSVVRMQLPLQEKQVHPWVRKIPWRRKWQPTLVFLPGESRGQRGLAGYSLWSGNRVGHHWSKRHMQFVSRIVREKKKASE